uniref:7TM_GPCR_Srx domain-containing protein n=1 Tax=Parastrongyloides trichosuri TaxID=131310 RepID=A0A0N4ZVY1_PARTI
MNMTNFTDYFGPGYPTLEVFNHYESFFRLRKVLNFTPFKIIGNHGVLSFIQQICHFITSIRTIVGNVEIDVLNKFIGSVLNASYIGSVALILLLTINRCDIMINHSIDRKKFYSYGIFICYFYAFILLIFYSLPCFNIVFSKVFYEWIYLKACNWSIYGFQVENKSVLSFLALSTFLYIIMFLKLMHLRSYTTTNKIVVLNDIKFLVHVLLCFASVGILEFCWSGILKNIYMNEFTSMVPHFIFIFVSGTNTLSTFCFVKEIRDDVISCLRCQRLNKVQSINKPNVIQII